MESKKESVVGGMRTRKGNEEGREWAEQEWRNGEGMGRGESRIESEEGLGRDVVGVWEREGFGRRGLYVCCCFMP